VFTYKKTSITVDQHHVTKLLTVLMVCFSLRTAVLFQLWFSVSVSVTVIKFCIFQLSYGYYFSVSITVIIFFSYSYFARNSSHCVHRKHQNTAPVLYVCIYLYMFIYVRLYLFICIYVYVCMYVRVCVCFRYHVLVK